MPKTSFQFLPSERTQKMQELAKRARLSLSRFANSDVQYDAVGLQLLDEWIDRHIRQFPKPNQRIQTIWGAFLGEVFRERFNGAWALDKSQRKPRLGVLCPREHSGLLFIPVMEQVQHRVQDGMQASLTLYYTMKGIELKS